VALCVSEVRQRNIEGLLGCEQGHALRAAINTPIQGSAADVATAAMLAIARCEELRKLGWKMLLQVRAGTLGSVFAMTLERTGCSRPAQPRLHVSLVLDCAAVHAANDPSRALSQSSLCASYMSHAISVCATGPVSRQGIHMHHDSPESVSGLVRKV
jgi:hypothetical protein